MAEALDTITDDANSNNRDDLKPFVGMSFDSVDSCKLFYRKYAMKKGFAIRIRNSKKGPDEKLRYFVLTCEREGRYESTKTAGVKTNATKKIQCPVRITVTFKDGKWFLLTVIDDHCHDLSPHLFPGNKKIDMCVQRVVQINDEADARANESYHSLVCASGGYENLSSVERDVRNFVDVHRRAIGKEGDAKALLNYFSRMREYNKDFFYEIGLDNDFFVENVFWADARSRAAYEYFGDVVSFDTTYLTNKYDMPLVSFTGVNHHGQSILFGCGLMSAEDSKSFTWLFQTWLRCMSSKAPLGIVTDQCKAMQNSIEEVFPNTVHRWCLWHIMKKIPEKLKDYGKYKSIKNAMENCVYDSLSINEFNHAWIAFVETYNLGENDWLNSIFEERQRWVPCFIKHHFWAGMSTMQRSESMNTFFDKHIKASTTLREFLEQYDNALQEKAEKEYEVDFRSFNTTIPCGSHSMIEKHFQDEYTHAKFNEVQAEFRGKINCCVVSVSSNGCVSSYNVLEESIVCGQPRELSFCVDFYRGDHDVDVKCTCFLFEFKGIICRHSLLVLAQERVKQVTSKFILPRWSKKVKRKYAYIKTSYDVKMIQPHIERFEGLCKRFHEIAENAAESITKTADLHKTINTWAEENVKQNDSVPQ